MNSMKRLGRCAFHALTLLSLVLFAAAAVTVFRTYGKGDYIYNNRHTQTHLRSLYIRLAEGRIECGRLTSTLTGPNRTRDRMEDEQIRFTARAWVLSIPYWLCALLALILPASMSVSFARSLSRRRRARKGLCVYCGYDLRATPTRCPECGQPQAKVQSPQ
jgi:hypothetical protein